MIDKLKAWTDPGFRSFCRAMLNGNYVGGIYGTNNTYAQKSHVGDVFHDPTLEGLILDYAEVEFLLAEAKERGFTVAGTAAEHYNAGITASMEYWGVDDADITAYLAQTCCCLWNCSRYLETKDRYTAVDCSSTTEVLKDGLCGEGWISPALMFLRCCNILIFLTRFHLPYRRGYVKWC